MSEKWRIIIAEDNDGDVALLQEALEVLDLPHELHVLSDGEQALQLVERVNAIEDTLCPDLFVLDLHLPRVDGLDILRRIRLSEKCKNIPVIVLSGSAAPAMRATVESFSSLFVSKPTNFDDFMHIGQIIKGALEPTNKN